MNKFNKSEYGYLFGILNSPRALRILDFLLERPDGATYAEIEKRPREYLDAPTVSVPELMQAGLINGFDKNGKEIPIVISRDGRSYVPERKACVPKNTFRTSDFGKALIKFLDENNTSLDMSPPRS